MYILTVQDASNVLMNLLLSVKNVVNTLNFVFLEINCSLIEQSVEIMRNIKYNQK